MEAIRYELKGVKEIQEALLQLPAKVNAKLLQSVHRKTAKKFIIDSLRAGTPYSSTTKKSFVVQNDREDPTAVFAGPSSDAFWIRFVEKGTKQRETKKGYNRGSITGKNTIEPIVDQQIEPIINYVNTQYGEEIENFLQKRIKKINK